MDSIPGWERSPGGGHGNPHQSVFLPGAAHGQGSLAGYSPQGCTELDMTEETAHTQPAILILGIHPKEMKAYDHAKTHMNVHNSFIDNS